MKTQTTFALSIVTENGGAVFDCSKVNFLVALELEYFLFIWGLGEGRSLWGGVADFLEGCSE